MINISNNALLAIQRCKEEMVESFSKAIKDCGGCPKAFLRKELTLGEMMDTLAQNGVRFCYDPDGHISRKL